MHNFKIDTLVVGQLRTNCYFLTGEEGFIIIDPGDGADGILRHSKGIKSKPVAVVCTHGHFDHILAAQEVSHKLSVPFCLHSAEKSVLSSMWDLSSSFGISENVPVPDLYLHGDETWTLGAEEISIIHTPGHTPGSICLKAGNTLFTGDTLFKEGIGRMDYGGNNRQMIGSLDRLSQLEDSITILPGHGPGSTILNERENMRFYIEMLKRQA